MYVAILYSVLGYVRLGYSKDSFKILDHRILELQGLEGTFGDHGVQSPDKACSQQQVGNSKESRQVLSIFRYSTTPQLKITFMAMENERMNGEIIIWFQ